MSTETACPHCGAPLPLPSKPGQPESRQSVDVSASPAAANASVLYAPGSNDTCVISHFDPMATVAEPDPILGEFVGPSSAETSSASDAEGPSLNITLDRDVSSFGINLNTASPSKLKRKTIPQVDERDFEDEPRDRRNPWILILLGSYASAITIAFLWISLRPKREDVRETVDPGSPSIVTDPGREAGRSRKVEPFGPIPTNRIIPLGKSIALNSLEVTPIEIKRQDVTLQRLNLKAEPERKLGGKRALALRLLVRNTSKEDIFAPIDPAFVREREEGIVDTYIETASGEKVYPFPLAVSSELNIVGQSFDVLRPGESREVAIVSAPEAPNDSKGPFTWRIRLRTGIGQTGVIGIRWP